jgi:DNA-binding transcriptional MerR regulator
MSAQPARGYLSISEVLAQLRAEFPDISVSKIRFLETEGLIAPARAPSGYRRFTAADVERLRYILTAQREQYLPLRVIKERLARADLGGAQEQSPAAAAVPAQSGRRADDRRGDDRRGDDRRGDDRRAGDRRSADGQADGVASRLTRRELLDQAGITDPQLTELEMFGLLRRAEGRLYGRDALEVAQTAAALTAYGVEARHLRTVRAAVEREVNLIEHVVAPILKQRGAGARELAGQTAGELAGLAMRLHRALIEGALAEAGLVEAGLVEGGLVQAGRADSGSAGSAREEPARARRSGVGGASA